MTEERRQHPRIPVRTIVKMQFATIGEFLQSYAQNISEGGMQLAVAQELQEGDRVGLEFKLKSDYPLIQGTAVVRWCRPSGNHYLVGVAFEEIDERSRNTISEAIALKEKGAAAAATVDDADTIDVVEDLLSPPDEIEELAPEEIGFSTDVEGDLIDELSPPEDLPVGADEISIEEVSMDVAPADASGPEIESLELPGIEGAPAAGSGAEDVGELELPDADDEPFEIEEVGIPDAGSETESVADLFDDTEVSPEQLDFGTGFDATATGIADGSVSAAPEPSPGNRRRIVIVVALLFLTGGVLYWWMPRPVAPVAERPPLPDVVAPAPRPPGMPAVAAVTAEPSASESTMAATQPDTAAHQNGGETTATGSPAAAPKPQPHAVEAPVAAAEEPAAPEREPAPQPQPEPERASVEAPARRVVAMLRGSGRDWLVIEGDGRFEGRYRYFGLSDPPRAVVDLIGLQRAPGVRAPSFEDHAQVRRVRVGVHPDKIRLVLDLRRDTGFKVVTDGNRLIVQAR